MVENIKMLPVRALTTIFSEDKTILITGSKGDGKTNLAGVIKQTLVEIFGKAVWTNIHYFKIENVEKAKKIGKLADVPEHVYVRKPDNIYVVKSLSEMLIGIVNTHLKGKIFVLDEAGIHADSSIATSKNTRTIKQINRIIRHFDCCFIIITQTKGSVPPELREKDVDFHFRMKKTRQGYIVEIGKKKVENDEFTGEEKINFPTVKKIRVPLCKYPIDGKFPTGFNIDIDLKEVLDRLSEVDDSIEMMDEGLGKNIILEMVKEKQKKQDYLTTGQYGKKYGVTVQAVHEWIKKGMLEYIRTPGGRYRVKNQKPNYQV